VLCAVRVVRVVKKQSGMSDDDKTGGPPPPPQAINPNRRGGAGGKHEQGAERWSPDEDALIRRLCSERADGNVRHNWFLIKESFDSANLGPARSIHSIRNRMLRLRKNTQLVKAGKLGANRCGRCGQIKRGHVCTGAPLMA
jgi:hypothetical protein